MFDGVRDKRGIESGAHVYSHDCVFFRLIGGSCLNFGISHSREPRGSMTFVAEVPAKGPHHGYGRTVALMHVNGYDTGHGKTVFQSQSRCLFISLCFV